MCGRFTLKTPVETLVDLFQFTETPTLAPRYNIAPTQTVAAVRAAEDRGRELAMLRWGLVPAWADDPAIGHRMINARAETAADKPSFRSAFRHRRCLILADGFFEWKKENGRKQPYYIRLRDGKPFAFAGLWERWNDLETCTILTTAANELIRPLHDRMPVILAEDAYDLWLDPTVQKPEPLQPLLKSHPADRLTMVPVDPWVNNPRHDDPRCVQEVP